MNWSEAILASADPWDGSVFSGLDPDHRFGVLILALGCVTGIIISTVCMAFGLAKSVGRRRMEADLKREMLDRGMSADEITKVIEAALPLDDGTGRWIESWCKRRK
jgi:hypothetical protein